MKDTCEKRIGRKLESRIKDFKLALDGKYGEAIGDKSCKCEDFIDFINTYALDYTDHTYFRAKSLGLSYGGPQDYFLFFEDGTIEYHFLDWFDGAKIKLPEEGEDYKIMSEVRDKLNLE